MSDQQPPFSLLFRKSLDGDRPALQQLLYLNYDFLAGFLSRQLGPGDSSGIDRDDLLQEVFIHAIRDLENCRADDYPGFRAWLRAIAQNRIRDAIKHRRRKKRDGPLVNAPDCDSGSRLNLVELLPGQQQSPSSLAATAEATRTLDIWLATLPEQQRDAVRLRYMNRMSLEEIGLELDKSEGAVRGLLHRAKLKLRELMGCSSLWFSKH